jgi:hypothetical protein
MNGIIEANQCKLKKKNPNQSYMILWHFEIRFVQLLLHHSHLEIKIELEKYLGLSKKSAYDNCRRGGFR